MSLSKADLIECAIRHRSDSRSQMHVSGVPAFKTPHAWRPLRSWDGLVLVSTTDGRFAVGTGIRAGSELPRNVAVFTTRELADAKFDELKGLS